MRHAISHLRRAGSGSVLDISSIATTRGDGSGAHARGLLDDRFPG